MGRTEGFGFRVKRTEGLVSRGVVSGGKEEEVM